MKLSIIIPTYNEQENIGQLLPYLNVHGGEYLAEVIVSDGNSTDNTVKLAKTLGAKAVVSAEKGRPAQMNFGAQHSTGDVLYFVHADTLPPKSFVKDILAALNAGFPIGCYRFRFQSNSFWLKVNAWFTRFNFLFCRGGDQTLFITKELFQKLNGFKNDYVVMEDYDMIIRAKKQARFRIIPKEVMVSARKYDKNSYFRVNFANFIAFNMFRLGYHPQKILRTYKKLIRHPKADAV